MLIPSIDLLGGRIVQLVQGERLELAFDDFDYWINRFSGYPIVQLIDLDAAMRKGDNLALVRDICKRLPCQVGGGIRNTERAQMLLDAGAKKVILGSSLFQAPSDVESTPAKAVNLPFAAELEQAIGRENILAGIDTKNGVIAVHGWKASVPLTPDEAMVQLEPYCGGWLYTHVDTEGTLSGFPIDVARRLKALTHRKLIVAGGIREQSEIDQLDALGIDAVAGMAVYTGMLKA